MTQRRITAIAKTIKPELVNQCGAGRGTSCPCFAAGQEFTCGLGKHGEFLSLCVAGSSPDGCRAPHRGVFSRGISEGG